MNRSEVVALLKELIALNLVQPSFVSIDKNNQGTFDLTLKDNGNLLGIRAFLSDKDVVLFENKETGTCKIYKP